MDKSWDSPEAASAKEAIRKARATLSVAMHENNSIVLYANEKTIVGEIVSVEEKHWLVKVSKWNAIVAHKADK
jgi:hypothetical protein